MSQVKICGLQTIEDALEATKNGAQFLGIIFAKSKRQVEKTQAKEIVDAVRSQTNQSSDNQINLSKNQFNHINKDNLINWFNQSKNEIEKVLSVKRPLIIGVFSNQSSSEINDIVQYTGIDIVQLHGDETDSFCNEINFPIIRAIHVGEEDTCETVESRILAGYYHLILLDTKVTGLTQQGGSGKSFDWSVATQLKQKNIPFLLAGGLTPDNVTQALKVLPWSVDVSSGVETEGKKDKEKIKKFLKVTQDYSIEL